jgi:threonine/homoserine/homoserine lactone efflux protein
MSKLASSPAIAIVGAGAALANPGGFMAVALKDISQRNPSTAQYILEWLLFTIIALLPLALALVMLVVAGERTNRFLQRAREWLERHARTLAGVIVILLAVVLLRNGITGLTS